MFIKAVICGSYHRDPAGLRRIFRELEATGCRVLSPLSIDFIDMQPEVVRLRSEQDFTIQELEKFHLRAMKEADIIWLHAPGGYVGLSGALEIGYATALNKPVFCKELPVDEMLQSQIVLTNSVFDALEMITAFS